LLLPGGGTKQPFLIEFSSICSLRPRTAFPGPLPDRVRRDELKALACNVKAWLALAFTPSLSHSPAFPRIRRANASDASGDGLSGSFFPIATKSAQGSSRSPHSSKQPPPSLPTAVPTPLSTRRFSLRVRTVTYLKIFRSFPIFLSRSSHSLTNGSDAPSRERRFLSLLGFHPRTQTPDIPVPSLLHPQVPFYFLVSKYRSLPVTFCPTDVPSSISKTPQPAVCFPPPPFFHISLFPRCLLGE